jgi:hypothetical protein
MLVHATVSILVGVRPDPPLKHITWTTVKNAANNQLITSNKLYLYITPQHSVQ